MATGLVIVACNAHESYCGGIVLGCVEADDCNFVINTQIADCRMFSRSTRFQQEFLTFARLQIQNVRKSWQSFRQKFEQNSSDVARFYQMLHNGGHFLREC